MGGLIKKAYQEEKQLPWPPTAEDLDSNNLLPDKLGRFLTLIISCISDAGKIEEKTARLVLEINQVLCRATTDGEWKLPKHILLCTTMRHLFRSKQLITMLNRLGYSGGNEISQRH